MSELKDRLPSKNELGLIRLKYSYKFETMFEEPCDEWLEVVEGKCNEVLRNFNKKEDESLTATFGARKTLIVFLMQLCSYNLTTPDWLKVGEKRK
jgi:hypothetical protein